MAARDKRRADIAKFLDAVKSMRIPAGSANERAIWVILARHGTKDGATRACDALWSKYVSPNEFRVAKVGEVADIVAPYVKNDPMAVAAEARGFLRTYFKEWQMVDPAASEVKPAHELKKYLSSLETDGRGIALALALYYCQRELEEQHRYGQPPEDGSKPKKRPENEVTASANRMRLLFNYSAHGTVTPEEAHAGKAFVRAWAYKALPASPKRAAKGAEKAAAKTSKKTAAKSSKKTTKKAPTRKKSKVAKKATGKKAAKKAPAKRTTRGRATTKKSSRR